MKTLLLVRHAKPQKGPWPDAPLSPEGVAAAKDLSARERARFAAVSYAAASPLCRAQETARLFGVPFVTDACLEERRTGDTAGQDERFWKRQYDDPDFKNPDGESLREAGSRLAACAAEALACLPEGGTAALFTHAGTLCGFLMRFCEVTVTDLLTKSRKITFRGDVVLDGPLAAPACFVVEVEGGEVIGVEYCAGM